MLKFLIFHSCFKFGICLKFEPLAKTRTAKMLIFLSNLEPNLFLIKG